MKLLLMNLVFLANSCFILGCNDTSNFATCKFYKEKGYCTTVDWLAKKCLKTCGLCDCLDLEPLSICELYKKKGYCLSVSWLAMRCTRTCGLCDNSTVTTVHPPIHTTTPIVSTSKLPVPTPLSTTMNTLTVSTIEPSTYSTKATTINTTRDPMPVLCGKSMMRGRVIGGSTSRYGQWPWQANLIYGNFGNCGATLIKPNWLVTAAHCTIGKNVTLFKVTLGKLHRYKSSSHEQTQLIDLVIEHKDYKKPVRVDNDIALLRLRRPVFLNQYVNTACLPEKNTTLEIGQQCFISGWGKTMNSGFGAQELHHGRLSILNQAECITRNKHLAPVTDRMICGSNSLPSRQSGCHGDSGGPFVCQEKDNRWVLQGAVSWGSPVCKIHDGATVFTKISYYREWIDEQIKKYSN